MSANFVARQTGYDMRDWGEGDRTTNDWFRPLETFAERFDELLARIGELGFDAVDVWGAHLHPEWATREHLAAAREALDRRSLRVASIAGWFGSTREEVERACDVAEALGTTVLGGMTSLDRAVLVPLLRERGLRLGVENHPEKTPQELLAKVAGDGVVGVTVDTGWFATHAYDPARALEELAPHLVHVHLKDVLAAGAHETCRWGRGCVPVEECVRTLRRIGYEGAISVEHEPERYDPSDDCREMRVQLEEWLR